MGFARCLRTDSTGWFFSSHGKKRWLAINPSKVEEFMKPELDAWSWNCRGCKLTSCSSQFSHRHWHWTMEQATKRASPSHRPKQRTAQKNINRRKSILGGNIFPLTFLHRSGGGTSKRRPSFKMFLLRIFQVCVVRESQRRQLISGTVFCADSHKHQLADDDRDFQVPSVRCRGEF